MKKLAQFAIVAAAMMMAFACDDDDKKADNGQNQEPTWNGGSDEARLDFFQTKYVSVVKACVESKSVEVSQNDLNELENFGNQIEACVDVEADYFQCLVDLDCDTLLELEFDLSELPDGVSLGKCETASEKYGACVAKETDPTEKYRAAMLACVEPSDTVGINQFKEELLTNAADRSECLDKYHAFYECAAQQSCSFLLNIYENTVTSYGDCALAKRELDSCIDTNYAASPLDSYLALVDSCVKDYNLAHPGEEISDNEVRTYSGDLNNEYVIYEMCNRDMDKTFACYAALDCETVLELAFDLSEIPNGVDTGACEALAEAESICIDNNSEHQAPIDSFITHAEYCMSEYNMEHSEDQIEESEFNSYKAQIQQDYQSFALCNETADAYYSCIADMDCEKVLELVFDLSELEDLDLGACESASSADELCLGQNYSDDEPSEEEQEQNDQNEL